jgi:hypothetical protein
MFKSIKFLKYLEFNSKTNLYSDLYKIIDDDFEEEIMGERPGNSPARFGGGEGAIINCYSKRNLNVPKNLFLFFMFNEKQYGSIYYNIQQQISYCMKNKPLFPKYKEDVEKYLLLL